MLNKIIIMKIFYISKFQTGASLATVDCPVVYMKILMLLCVAFIETVLLERHESTYVTQRKATY